MSTHTDSEIASSYEQLSPERREQVLEYARWLRANEAELPARLRSRCPPRAALHQPSGKAHPTLGPAMRGLSCAKRVLIEDYVLSLASGRGTPGYVFLQFAGTIPEESLRRMEQVIEEACERIDYDEW